MINIFTCLLALCLVNDQCQMINIFLMPVRSLGDLCEVEAERKHTEKDMCYFQPTSATQLAMMGEI